MAFRIHSVHPLNIKDIIPRRLPWAKLPLFSSHSLADAVQESPTVLASVFLVGGTCPAERQEAGERTDRTGSPGLWCLRESNMALAGDHKRLKQRPHCCLREVWTNCDEAIERKPSEHSANPFHKRKKPFVCSLCPYMVHSVHNYVLFCEKMKRLEFLISCLGFPVGVGVHFLLSSRCNFPLIVFNSFFHC